MLAFGLLGNCKPQWACETVCGMPAEEANDAGLKIAVCSTSNERAVSKIVEVLILPSVNANIRVFAGDVVPKKKPDPAIYNLAAQELGLQPSR